jgi:hypothetical protein
MIFKLQWKRVPVMKVKSKEAKDMTDETEESKKKWGVSGLFIPAGLFVGMGIGWALGYLV